MTANTSLPQQMSSECRFGDQCVYLDGPHREHAWNGTAPATRVNGTEGWVYVFSLADNDEFPNEVLIGLQRPNEESLAEAALSIEQAARLLTLLAEAVHYGIDPEVTR